VSEPVEFYLKDILSNVQGEIVWRTYATNRSEEIKPMGCRCDYCGSFSGTGHTNCKNCGAPLKPPFLVV
jgi:uncharacterized OB-fold protein